VLIIRF